MASAEPKSTAPLMRHAQIAHADGSYLAWMRSVATQLGNPYTDRTIKGTSIALMRGRINEAHSDAATPQMSLQLCLGAGYEVTADLGAGRFRVRRRSGDFIIGPPYQEIRLSGASKQGIDMLVLAMDWDDVSALCDGDRLRRAIDQSRVGLVRDDSLSALLLDAWNTQIHADGDAMYGEEFAQRVVSRLMRLADMPARPLPGGLAPWQVTRVTGAMRDRLAESVRLADVAGLVGLSPFHFTRAFRTTTGRTPYQMLVELRLERAKELLSTTNLTVLEVAMEVGYGSGQAFGRVFKRAFGVCPEQYRASTHT